MLTYKIHLVRTGSTGYRENQQYVGQSDVPLSPEGRENLLHLRETMKYPNAQVVFSSPLTRCLETADLLYPNTQLFPMDQLKDMDLGDFEGKSFQQLQTQPEFIQWTENSLEHPPPHGERMEEFTTRVVSGLEGIFHQMMEERLTSVAAMTHSGVIMTLLSAVGIPKLPMHHWAAANGHGFTLLMTPQMWMRDGVAEIYNHLPLPPLEDDFNLHTYDNF